MSVEVTSLRHPLARTVLALAAGAALASWLAYGSGGAEEPA
jgi:hypothetical protein